MSDIKPQDDDGAIGSEMKTLAEGMLKQLEKEAEEEERKAEAKKVQQFRLPTPEEMEKLDKILVILFHF